MFEEIEKKFELNRNDENASKMARYMRNQFEFYGIATPIRKTIYKDLLKADRSKKVVDWDFLDKCYQNPYREFQYLAQDYLALMQPFLRYEDIAKIKSYIKTSPWWDTVDGIDVIIGNIGLIDCRVDDLMLEWSTDHDFWIRRIAIDHQLSRKEKTNAELLEKILVNNFGTKEFFINKAIGWSLREYSKYNLEWVKDFLSKYRDQLNPLSIKEASKYL